MNAYPPPPYPCQSVLEFRIERGETVEGPLYVVVVPDHKVSLQLPPGVKLHGPMKMQLCDGHLEFMP